MKTPLFSDFCIHFKTAEQACQENLTHGQVSDAHAIFARFSPPSAVLASVFSKPSQKNRRRLKSRLLSKALIELFAFHFCKAVAAINRAVFSRLKRNACFRTAGSAGCGEHFSLGLCTAVFARHTALFASLRLVLEAFLSIELLFTGSEYELRAAVFTNEGFVLIHD